MDTIRHRSPLLRVLAAVAALGLLVAACGQAEEEPEGEATATAGATEQPTVTGRGDGTLTIGRVLPETGALAPLGVPELVSVDLAIEAINDAGGVLGEDVQLLKGDSGTDPVVARQTVNRLLSEGADGIVGAASSGVTQQGVIGTLHDAEIAQCSPANTSPAFSTQENADFYFRTVPPDNAVAPIMTQRIAGDGHTSVGIVAIANDYGQGLLELLEQSLQDQNIDVPVTTTYSPETTNFSANVDDLTGQTPDAIVIIGYSETAALIRGLLEEDVSPDQLYGADGIFLPGLPGQVGAGDGALDGMTVIGASGSETYNTEQLDAALDEDNKGNWIYGAQAYDCVIIHALAAQAAGTDDSSQYIDQVRAVTGEGGTKCTSFEECKGLLEDGEDIDYDGPSGPIDLAQGYTLVEGGSEEDTSAGDPSFGRYAITQFQDGGDFVQVDSQDINLAELLGGEGEATADPSPTEG